MLLQVSCILIFHFFWVTSALQCHDCKQTFNLTSSETINTNKMGCNLVDTPYSSCSQLLHVQYSEKSASVFFAASPSESPMLPTAARLMINTTMIWLDRLQLDRIFQIFCFDANACSTNAINDTYMQREL
jgi:hypothetical protein